MILNYQSRKKLEPKPPAPQTWARIEEVHGNKARLRFSENDVSSKFYGFGQEASYRVGQKVLIRKVSGTYIIETSLGD